MVLQLSLHWNETWRLVRVNWAAYAIASKSRHLVWVVILLVCYNHAIYFEKVLSPASGVMIVVQLSNVRVFLCFLERINTFSVQSCDRNLRERYNLLAKFCHAWIAWLILDLRVKEQTVDLFRHFIFLRPFQICLYFDWGHRGGLAWWIKVWLHIAEGWLSPLAFSFGCFWRVGRWLLMLGRLFFDHSCQVRWL